MKFSADRTSDPALNGAAVICIKFSQWPRKKTTFHFQQLQLKSSSKNFKLKKKYIMCTFDCLQTVNKPMWKRREKKNRIVCFLLGARSILCQSLTAYVKYRLFSKNHVTKTIWHTWRENVAIDSCWTVAKWSKTIFPKLLFVIKTIIFAWIRISDREGQKDR